MDQLAINAHVIEQYRAGGEVTGMHRDRLLLLTTTGRRSGESRTAPMMFVRDRGEPVVIASNLGAATHPAWFENLTADPAVTVELPDAGPTAARAEVLDADHDRVWADVVAANPFFREHQEQAGDRRIPLVKLHLAD